MAVTDLSQGDYLWLTEYGRKCRNDHEENFLRKIDPTLIRAQYRGRTDKEYRKDNQMDWREDEHVTPLTQMFNGGNTILSQSYYQAPAPIVLPKRGTTDDDAALMCAILKHYRKVNRAKEQNQEAVLNAFFFGIGWKKIGYRTVFAPQTEEPESQPDPGLMQKIMQAGQSLLGMKPSITESREVPLYVDSETLYNDSESPMNVMVDYKNDIKNSRVILHRLPRTLHDIQVSGFYEPQVVQDIIKHFQNKIGNSRFDIRDVEVQLNEMHVKERNGIYVLTYIDEFTAPLRYEKQSCLLNEFLFSPLILTNEPGVRYPVSHMKVASQTQTKLDKLMSMFVETVARSRRMLAVNTKSLQPGEESNLERNLVQGILKFKKEITGGDLQNIASSPVGNDLIQLITALRSHIVQVLGADEQLVSGKSENDTLGQDELARIGTKIRESGIMDKIRDWEIDQLTKEAALIKQYSNTELFVQINPDDYQNPEAAMEAEPKWLEFMTQNNPMGAKNYLQGEFDFDINIDEAVKPNKSVIQAQLAKIIEVISNPAAQEALLNDNTIVRTGLLYEDWIKNTDGVGNPKRYLQTLDSMQKAAFQTQQLLKQNPQLGMPNVTAVPKSGKAPGMASSSKPDGGGSDVSQVSSKAAQL